MKQREIKFRIWDSVANVMYEPFELKEIMVSKEAPGMADHYMYLQFTGLKDKNGRDIYEGDILDIIQYEGNGKEIARAKNKVRWDGAEAKFDFEWATNGIDGIGGSDLDIFLFNFRGRGKNTMDWYLDFEIIGNIYENPELLKSI